MAKPKGHRANKPNDNKGTINDDKLYKGNYREEVYKEEEDEVEAKTEEQVDPVEEKTATQPVGESFVSPKKETKEVDYKKRYDDLKRHYDAKQAEWKQQLESSQQPQKENLTEFKDKYPDVHNAVEEIATNRTEAQLAHLKEELDQLKEKEKLLEKEKAYEELLRLQPSFSKLKDDEKFINWLKEQPSSISDGIYKNNTDARWASRVIDLYIADTGKPKREVKKAEDAATSVQPSQPREVNTGNNNKKVWKASEIERMKPWDFEKYEKDIDAARVEGRIDFSS